MFKKKQFESLSNSNDISKIGEYLSGFSFGTSPKKEDIETFCCLIYVYFLVKEKLLDLPIKVLWDDRPDFSLSFHEISVGLEVTTATTSSLQHAYAVANKEFPPGSLIEMSEYWSNTTSKEIVKKGIRKPGERFQGCGWGDYGQEKQWIECVKRSIANKTELLNKPYFKKYSINDLVIFDDTPTVCPHLDYAIPKLQEFRDQIKMLGSKRFDKIHVITDNHLLYDLFNNLRTIDISKSKISN